MIAGLAEEVARIDAEESLAAVNVMQIGAGVAKNSHARRLIARWRRLVGRPARKPLTEDQWRARLAASGISLEIVDGK